MENKTAEETFKIEVIENPFVGPVYPSKKKWGVKFTIGVQSFTLSIQRCKTDAQWYEDQLRTALNNLVSLQCAEMKEELESWKKEHFETVEMAAANIKEMKEENERLKERIEGYEFGEQFKDSPFTSTSHLIKEVSQLQEEVERLRGVLGENKQVMEWHLDHSVPFLLSDHSDFFNMTANAIEQTRQALSGKESKTE